MVTRRFLWRGIVIAMLALLASVLAGGAPSVHSQSAVAPAATPEAALGAAVAALGQGYAGGCDTAQSPRDIGKLCSRYVADCGGLRAYLVGRTFSEYTDWFFLLHGEAGWIAVATVTLGLSDSLIAVPWPGGCQAPPADSTSEK